MPQLCLLDDGGIDLFLLFNPHLKKHGPSLNCADRCSRYFRICFQTLFGPKRGRTGLARDPWSCMLPDYVNNKCLKEFIDGQRTPTGAGASSFSSIEIVKVHSSGSFFNFADSILSLPKVALSCSSMSAAVVLATAAGLPGA